MRKGLLILMIALLILPACTKKKEEKTAYKKQPINVEVETVTLGVFIRELNFKGTVFPWKRANIGPEISGRIARIYKKQGDRVKKGDLLAELDTTTLKLQKKQMEAALGVAGASHKDALLNYQRIEKLFNKEAVSQMQYEKSSLALEAADTQMKSAEANLDVVKHTLSKSHMRAPFDGIITSKNQEEGDMINPMMGMSAGVLTLMDLNKVKIIINVPAENIEQISLGQECKTQISSLKDEVFSGKIYSKNLAADPSSKTFKVEILIHNPDMKIKSGIFAEVNVEVMRKENTILLPHSAVVDEENVVLYNEGIGKMIKVKIGDRNNHCFEIIEGLELGQIVVVKGNYDLKEGALISVQGETK